MTQPGPNLAGLRETAHEATAVLSRLREQINATAVTDRGRIAAELAPDIDRAAAGAQKAWEAYFTATGFITGKEAA